MTRGPNNHRFFEFGAESGDARGGAMRTEIEDHVSLAYHPAQIIALIDLAHDLELLVVRRAGDKCSAHAPFRACDNKFEHVVAREPALCVTMKPMFLLQNPAAF